MYQSRYNHAFIEDQKLAVTVAEEWGYRTQTEPSTFKQSKIIRKPIKVASIKPLSFGNQIQQTQSMKRIDQEINRMKIQKQINRLTEKAKNQGNHAIDSESQVVKMANILLKQYNFIINHQHILEKKSNQARKILKLNKKSLAEEILQQIEDIKKNMQNADLSSIIKMNEQISNLYKKYHSQMDSNKSMTEPSDSNTIPKRSSITKAEQSQLISRNNTNLTKQSNSNKRISSFERSKVTMKRFQQNISSIRNQRKQQNQRRQHQIHPIKDNRFENKSIVRMEKQKKMENINFIVTEEEDLKNSQAGSDYQEKQKILIHHILTQNRNNKHNASNENKHNANKHNANANNNKYFFNSLILNNNKGSSLQPLRKKYSAKVEIKNNEQPMLSKALKLKIQQKQALKSMIKQPYMKEKIMQKGKMLDKMTNNSNDILQIWKGKIQDQINNNANRNNGKLLLEGQQKQVEGEEMLIQNNRSHFSNTSLPYNTSLTDNPEQQQLRNQIYDKKYALPKHIPSSRLDKEVKHGKVKKEMFMKLLIKKNNKFTKIAGTKLIKRYDPTDQINHLLGNYSQRIENSQINERIQIQENRWKGEMGMQSKNTFNANIDAKNTFDAKRTYNRKKMSSMIKTQSGFKRDQVSVVEWINEERADEDYYWTVCKNQKLNLLLKKR